MCLYLHVCAYVCMCVLVYMCIFSAFKDQKEKQIIIMKNNNDKKYNLYLSLMPLRKYLLG